MNDTQGTEVTFPRSQVVEFYRTHPDWHRKGPLAGQFLDFMKIDETPENKAFFDRLRSVGSSDAGRLIIKHTNWEN